MVGVAHQIENEYFNMIDQIVIACDSSFNILYSNYHEKFFDKIISKVGETININEIRLKCASRIDKCFILTSKTLETETRTMRLLMKMFEAIEYNPEDQIKVGRYRSIGVLQVLESMYAYVKQHKLMAERKSTKQLNIESRRSQFSNMQLIVRLCSFRTASLTFMSFSALYRNSVIRAGRKMVYLILSLLSST